MATNYPTSLDSYSTKVNSVDTVEASHVNNLQDAVVAVETELGAGASRPTATATASTIARRNAAGYAFFANLTARIYRTTNQSINDSTWTAISFDQVMYNVGPLWAIGNPTRITAVVTGSYRVFANIGFAANATGRRVARIVHSVYGTIAQHEWQFSTANEPMLQIATEFSMSTGEYLTFEVFQSSGGALNVLSYAYWSPHVTVTVAPAAV